MLKRDPTAPKLSMVKYFEVLAEKEQVESIKKLPSSRRRAFENAHRYSFETVLGWAKLKLAPCEHVSKSKLGKIRLRGMLTQRMIFELEYERDQQLVLHGHSAKTVEPTLKSCREKLSFSQVIGPSKRQNQ